MKNGVVIRLCTFLRYTSRFAKVRVSWHDEELSGYGRRLA